MKKLSVLLLSALLIFTAAACGKQPEEASRETEGTAAEESTDSGSEAGTFRVGFGRKEVNPTSSVPIGGYGNTFKRMSTGNFDYLYTTSVAISDEEDSTVVFITVDIGNFGQEFAETLRNKVSTETGLPKERIMVSCTHTHSSPDLWSTTNFGIQEFMRRCESQTVAAVQESLNDRKPAKMFINSAKSVGMNYVRRYLMSDGTYGGDNFGDFVNAHPVSHETEADPYVRMIKFTREGGKDVLMTNYQVHGIVSSATHTGEPIYYEISPDFVGSFRRSIEKEKDCLVAYYLGGSGNVNPSSRITEEKVTTDVVEYGTKLASFVLDSYDACKEVKTGAVKAQETTVRATVNHAEDALLNQARQIKTVCDDPDSSPEARKEVLDMGKEFGILNQHHANQIVTKASLEKEQNVNLNAVRIGDVAFGVAPYEMFDTDANKIRDGVDYEMTFVLGYSNGYLGYMPDSAAYAHGGYEQFSCRFIQGESDKFVDSIIGMLTEMK